MSCEEMILSWARVYASHGKVADPESGRLLAKEFMQLWALPALSAEETEEYMFQAHVALYQIRTKASRVDEYVRVSQVREMLHGPVLGPLLQPSPAADMPRIPFTLLEYKLYHPEVQQHLYDKRKAVRPRALRSPPQMAHPSSCSPMPVCRQPHRDVSLCSRHLAQGHDCVRGFARHAHSGCCV